VKKKKLLAILFLSTLALSHSPHFVVVLRTTAGYRVPFLRHLKARRLTIRKNVLLSTSYPKIKNASATQLWELQNLDNLWQTLKAVSWCYLLRFESIYNDFLTDANSGTEIMITIHLAKKLRMKKEVSGFWKSTHYTASTFHNGTPNLVIFSLSSARGILFGMIGPFAQISRHSQFELLVTSENCSFVTLGKINSRYFREDVMTFKAHLKYYSNNALFSFQVFHFGYHSTWK